MTDAQHEYKMLTRTIIALNHALASRKRADIARRPETRQTLEKVRAKRAALLTVINQESAKHVSG